MGEYSKIEWTHHTFNPWRGCTKVSEGCKFCYADTMSKRNPSVLGVWGSKGSRVVAAESYWRQPLKWNAEAAQSGARRRVFCASLADVFEGEGTMPAEAWPLVQQARGRLWALIEQTPALDWLLLTKRPENAGAMVPWGPFGVTPAQWLAGERESMVQTEPWPNVWGGVTTENQDEADRRLVHILGDETRPRTVDFAVTFASYEPALGPVIFDGSAGGRNWLDAPALDWIIAGDESGAGRRPASLEWFRSVRDQIALAGGRTGFHFKQWCGPDVAGIGGERVKGKIHLPVLDGAVHDAGPMGHQ